MTDIDLYCAVGVVAWIRVAWLAAQVVAHRWQLCSEVRDELVFRCCVAPGAKTGE